MIHAARRCKPVRMKRSTRNSLRRWPSRRRGCQVGRARSAARSTTGACAMAGPVPSSRPIASYATRAASRSRATSAPDMPNANCPKMTVRRLGKIQGETGRRPAPKSNAPGAGCQLGASADEDAPPRAQWPPRRPYVGAGAPRSVAPRTARSWRHRRGATDDRDHRAPDRRFCAGGGQRGAQRPRNRPPNVLSAQRSALGGRKCPAARA